jgi:RNA polymerase sigma factor (sigma-70 family)
MPDFNQLITDYSPGLYGFAQNLSRRSGMAEDLVQQTFLLWAKKGHTLRDQSKVKTWLYTTLYREWLAVARREKRYGTIEFDVDLHGAQTEASVAPRIESATLREALDQLPEKYRSPLVLFYLRELSYREIADTLSLPIGTIMSRLSRGKDALRAALQPLTQEALES